MDFIIRFIDIFLERYGRVLIETLFFKSDIPFVILGLKSIA